MRNLRTRPSRQIEEFFIPTERKSSLRSQAYPSANTTAKKLSSVLCIDSDTTEYKKGSPSRKRDKVFDVDSDESEPEIHPSPTKRAKANKARLSYPSPPSDKDEIIKTPSVETEAMPGTMLLNLPLEIHQNIISLLPSDQDVNNYGAACKVLRACVGPIVWQKRFLRVFDNIPGADPVKLQAQYKKRQGIAKRFISFEEKALPGQTHCLDMIKEMIIESNAHVYRDKDNNEIVGGHNHHFLTKYFQYIASDGRLKGTNLLDNIAGSLPKPFLKKKRPPGQKSLTMVIKLCFVHLVLHPDICNTKTSIFLASQEQVYKCFTETPLFRGKNKYEINLPWLLHAANFFKFHFKTPDGEGILAHMYQQLEKGELPMAWTGKLKSGTQKLGPHWKGAFTFLHEDELEHYRLGHLYENVVDETTEGNNGFQDLTLFSDLKSTPQLACPPEMDTWLKGSPMGEYTDEVSGEKVMPKVQDFFGLGRSEVDYHLHGRIHGLPPQDGIPGFQRVSMLKYLPCVNGMYGTGRTSFWAYEGCVLPGNQIMLGRWWCPTGLMDRGRTYCGPFIFWRVSGSAEDRMRTTDDALTFLDRVEKKTVG
ncbi:hypothetical protein V502_09571 [Pseudogymnoascus sp. VKM F-4520 (FW-2644)]|nr:hypothetical protein V502_09571 [Pseudogymnoascus sp. VKM F-4520 (FW-2644)]